MLTSKNMTEIIASCTIINVIIRINLTVYLFLFYSKETLHFFRVANNINEGAVYQFSNCLIMLHE